MDVDIRPIAEHDRSAWSELFRGYREFYRLAPDDDVVERVWSWLMDPEHEVAGLVAVADRAVVGLAHWRRFARPSTGSVGLWLDDLFAIPEARGLGIGASLVAAVRGVADLEGASVVRWITAEDNATAQRLYDRVATRTTWVTYDATPER